MKTIAGIALYLALLGLLYIIGDWLRLRRIVVPEWLAGLLLVVGIFIACAIHILRDGRKS